MVKSKVLKQLRKQVENAEKLDLPSVIPDSLLQLPSLTSSSEQIDGNVGCNAVLSIQYASSKDMSSDQLEQCLDLFERNMGDLYKQSSWGLDMDAKRDELQHHKSRFWIVTSENNKVAAFLHFRFCMDVDEEPTCACLYVYEIQVDPHCQMRGIGRHLMTVSESIAQAAKLDKVMLTVFKKNTAALQFYRQRLEYDIDSTSPSQHGEPADYEIVSKQLKKA